MPILISWDSFSLCSNNVGDIHVSGLWLSENVTVKPLMVSSRQLTGTKALRKEWERRFGDAPKYTLISKAKFWNIFIMYLAFFSKQELKHLIRNIEEGSTLNLILTQRMRATIIKNCTLALPHCKKSPLDWTLFCL